jgi:hypothetical protein
MHIGVSSDGRPSGMCIWTVLKVSQRWKEDSRTSAGQDEGGRGAGDEGRSVGV